MFYEFLNATVDPKLIMEEIMDHTFRVNPPARQDYYYFKCKAPGEPSGTDSRETKDNNIFEVQVFPPICYRHNIHEGAAPYVPVALEDIPNYFTEDNWQTCITTIRTIGTVRRLENEFYLIESIDESAGLVQVPLTRGTNRELRPFTNSINIKSKKLDPNNKKKKIQKKKHGDKKESDKAADANAKKSKARELPFPDAVTDPSTLGDRRVKNGAVYILLGKLEWANGKPIIDVHRFITVHDLKTTYEAFILQNVIARREMEYYKAHHAEITEIVRKPNEIRKPLITQPPKKQTWKR